MNERDIATLTGRQSAPFLRVGTIIPLFGGRFRVKSFGRKCLVLEAMPGVRIEKTVIEPAKEKKTT